MPIGVRQGIEFSEGTEPRDGTVETKGLSVAGSGVARVNFCLISISLALIISPSRRSSHRRGAPSHPPSLSIPSCPSHAQNQHQFLSLIPYHHGLSHSLPLRPRLQPAQVLSASVGCSTPHLWLGTRTRTLTFHTHPMMLNSPRCSRLRGEQTEKTHLA